MSRKALGALTVAAVLVGCVGKPVAPSSAGSVRAAGPPGSALPDSGWRVVTSPRFFVSLPLPDAATWHVDDHSDRWLVATHVPSLSLLLVRGWREGSVVSHHQCESEARRLRPNLLGHEEAVLVDRRPLLAPTGFDTEVGFSVRRAKDTLSGVAVAVGANIRQCLVMAYVTRADGPDAARVIAQRLAFVTERAFKRAETYSVEDRVGPIVR